MDAVTATPAQGRRHAAIRRHGRARQWGERRRASRRTEKARTEGSWWTQPTAQDSRADFMGQAAAEHDRMRVSKIGQRMAANSTCDRWSLPAEIWLRRQQQKYLKRRTQTVDPIEDDDAITDDVDAIASEEL